MLRFCYWQVNRVHNLEQDVFLETFKNCGSQWWQNVLNAEQLMVKNLVPNFIIFFAYDLLFFMLAEIKG